MRFKLPMPLLHCIHLVKIILIFKFYIHTVIFLFNINSRSHERLANFFANIAAGNVHFSDVFNVL